MIYAGTIIEINKSKTYVFTMDCGVVALRTKKDFLLGQQITFTKRDKYPELIRTVSKKTMAIAAAFVLLVASTIVGGSMLGPLGQGGFDTECTALVSVDINPSIEISINKDEKIVAVQAKNEDGIKLLSNLDLKEMKLVDGVNKIIATAKEMGYMDESKKVVLVSAALYSSVGADASSEYAEQLKQILDTLETESDSADLLAVYIDDSAIIEEAKTNNLSIGKELLYKYAQNQETTLTAEQIRTASLSELLDKLNALEKDGKLVDTLQNPDAEKPADKETTVTPTAVQPEEKPETVKPTPTVEPAKDDFDPNLKVSTSGNTISFNWTGLPSTEVTYRDKNYSGFNFYKVVASQTNSHPSYPEDGYLTYISDYSDSDWSVNPGEGNYNYSPELSPGVTYYVSITYVFDNGKFTSETKTVTVPNYSQQEETANTVSSLGLSVSASGDALVFSWTPIGDSAMTYNGTTYKDFNFYKVVASKTNASPRYPEDGYLTYISDYNSSSWSVNPETDGYNQSPTLESGETYYFSITYVFGNGKVSSNTVQYMVP